jgi:hypothetical protein
VDAVALPNGTLAVLYYRVRLSNLAQLELWVRVGGNDLLVDTLDGVSQAASQGGLAYDAPSLRLGSQALLVAYSRPVSGVPQPEGYDIDTRERSRLTVVGVKL